MSSKLPLHYFTEPMHADMRYEEPDALSVHWLARYAIRCRDNPELLETIREELTQVLNQRLPDDELFDLWVSHAPGYTFEKGGLRLFLGTALAAFETAKLSMHVPVRHAKKI
jgi:hypothetical protein